MLNSAPPGLEIADKVECLPKKPKGKPNSKEKLHCGKLCGNSRPTATSSLLAQSNVEINDSRFQTATLPNNAYH
jgi:hypothetical protein